MKLIISYQPAKFQIPQLSELNFTEVGIRHLQKHYEVIMMSLHNYLVFEIAHFVELNKSCLLPKFIGIAFSDQILRGLVVNTPPQTYTLSKSPVLIGLS